MAIIDEITGGLAELESLLTANGTSLAGLGAAADKALADIKTNAAGGIETIAVDAVEAAFPQLKLFIEAAKLIQKIPGEHAADWFDPGRVAQDTDNPYQDTEAAAAAKARGET